MLGAIRRIWNRPEMPDLIAHKNVFETRRASHVHLG
jgi:hypothetical protein